MSRIALLTITLALAARSAAALDAPKIGDWHLSELAQSVNDRAAAMPPKQYFIDTLLDYRDKISPSFSIICQAQHFTFRLIDPHHPGRRWDGLMNILTDSGKTISVDARSEEPFELTALISSDVPKEALEKLSTSRVAISVSIDGWHNQLTFPAKGTDAALETLTIACSYDPKRNL